MAVRGDLETSGGDRRNDRTPRGDDPGHRVDDRWRGRQPDDRWSHRRRAAGDRGLAAVYQGNILTSTQKRDGSRRPFFDHVSDGTLRLDNETRIRSRNEASARRTG